jgi:AcrR family transcriptional regulator
MRAPRRPRRLTRTESKDLTRRRLLEAARTVFLRHGFHATTVDMVAEQAGFTKGAVYSTFASKADMFLALYEERIDERVAQFAPIAAAASADAERAIVRMWADVLRRERAWLLVLLEFWTFAARERSLRRRFASISARWRTSVAETIARSAQAAGRTLPVDAALLATSQMALGNGFALEGFRDPALATSEVYERVALALMHGLETLREETREYRREAAR